MNVYTKKYLLLSSEREKGENKQTLANIIYCVLLCDVSSFILKRKTCIITVIAVDCCYAVHHMFFFRF